MAYLAGMFLGAFLLLYLYYGYWFGDDKFSWKGLILPILFLWRDTCFFHCPACKRRAKRAWKINWIIAATGMIIGRGITDSLLRLIEP